MHRPLRHSFLMLALAAGLLAGCGGESPLDPRSGATGDVEQAAVSAELAAHRALVEDEIAESADETRLEDATPGTFAAIRPVTFWREIRDVNRRWEFAFADTDFTGRPTRAVVTLHKLLHGSFNILAASPEAEPVLADSARFQVVRKRLHDHWVRRFLLVRVPLANSDRTAWRLAATTGAEVTSFTPDGGEAPLDYGDTRIVSLRIETADLDTTITDPLEFFRLRNLLKIESQVDVKLTVTTLRNDDLVVLYWRHGRERFHNNGDNTYTGTWRTPFLLGPRHFGVNALAKGTVFDDELPYDSQAWILPYVVRGGEGDLANVTW
jgi:hypothetical protein